ncbi:phage portal protein [Pseudochrobactrum kiredjianiae]|uniref:Phage portal protein n=1 Tax=Pseudochrobactrum kiredjianiae TaxID=386305 RepID=A0ABW3V128_9HYPH|nr:phage portal protein [Pseudochrobactrum kiredjianiae]MDM7852666.1 phage portal protein [Pseudochrobactrum kiredjianiae]
MGISNILDKAIGYVSPQAGLRRIQQRAAMDIAQRSYTGAETSRLKSGRRVKSTSADAEVARAGRILRDRMRDLVRNNPYAAKAVSELVSHAIGDGIIPRSKDKELNKLFLEWSKHCDADGDLDFNGIVALAVREMFESGDGIVRRRRRRLEDGLPVPLQLQVLESDLIDTTKEGVLSGGGKTIQGIEFDALGRKRAYWMFGSHPGNSFFDPQSTIVSKPVPASDIAHVFEKQRTQVRGVPWGTPAMADTFDLAEYEKAELVRKRLEACLVGIMTGGDADDNLGMPVAGDDGTAQKPGIYNTRGQRVEKFEPGMFYNAVGGRDMKFSQPAVTDSYDPYKTSMLHTVAAGWRVPFALMTGRLDKVNYSSSKIGLEGFRRMVSMLQWQVIIPMLLQPMWDWFCEAAYLAGKISSPNVAVEWSPPRFYSADPLKDVNARIREVRAGFRSLSSAIAETGENPDDVLDEIASDNAKLDKRKIILDSDPRRISQAGQMQNSSDNEPPEEDKENET